MKGNGLELSLDDTNGENNKRKTTRNTFHAGNNKN